jgi:L-aminopeptidase/D-esterase-like protein
VVVVGEGVRDVAGVRVGHTTNEAGKTGCTVIAFDAPALTAVDVRGAAPGTRELDLLAPGRTVQRADAILLTGGSAFGLRAADGVMQALTQRGRGVPTPAIPVPIVSAAVIFDLANGAPAMPTSDDGARALDSARPLSGLPTGAVGAGTGARWGSIRGQDTSQPGGFGIAQIQIAGGTITALAVVNAFGVVSPDRDPRPSFLDRGSGEPPLGQSTTLLAVITDIRCTHEVLTRMCVAAHDALARVVWPSHTLVDGDVAFASTTHEGHMDARSILPVTIATELAAEAALLRGAGITT